MATFVQIPGIVEGRTGYIYKDLKIDRDIVANYHEYVDIEVEGTLLTGRVEFYLNGVEGSFLANQTITQFESSINPSTPASNVVRVEQASDLPSVLVADTTYLIVGEITIPGGSEITVSSNNAIIGNNRNIDRLIYTGSSNFITVTDQSFSLRNVGLRATHNTGKIMHAVNITPASSPNNYGRTEALELTKVKIDNSTNLWTIEGFELVDLNQCLVWYISDGTIGCQFKSNRHLEISSCEFYNWFEEGNPSNLDTYRMIEILADSAVGVGNGVVNISTSIIHPEITQDGLYINTSSTTGFGTISSNTFTDTNLTTGELFLPVVSAGVPDYSQTATYTYDIFSNQGILNSTSGTVMTLNGNTTTTSLTANTPTKVNTGGGARAQALVRFTVAADGRCTYNGTKDIYVSMHATLSYDKQGGGTDPYTFYFYKNGSLLTGSGTSIEASTTSGALSMVYGVLMSQNDYIEIYVENTSSNDNMTVSDFQVVIRE